MHRIPPPTTPPPELEVPLRQAADRLGPFARPIVWFPVVSSTNDVALTLAARGAAEGSVVAADAQTTGRGRHGRTWASPAGAGVYASVVLRPRPKEAPLLTIAAGVGIAEGIEAATGLRPLLKWPNDVYIGDRKLAGILAEAATSGDGVQSVVLGFGINVAPAAYPLEVAARATSLEAELGRPVDRGLVLAECLAALAARYLQLQTRREAIATAWRARAVSIIGRHVEWETAGVVERGIAEDIDDDGALRVRTGTGVVRVIAGEVRWV